MIRPLFLLAFVALPHAVRSLADDAVAVKRAVVLQHAKMIQANYSDCVAEAEVMETAMREFLAAPDAAKLDAARNAWVAARPAVPCNRRPTAFTPVPSMTRTDRSRCSIPGRSTRISSTLRRAAWIRGSWATSGRIPACARVMTRLNQADGEKNVACGWHAVEFLLGDRSAARNGTGRAGRSLTYTTAPNAKRRGEYLQACTDLIVRQLGALTEEWAPEDPNNYHANFRSVFEEGVDYIRGTHH